jgi:aminopeptidase N
VSAGGNEEGGAMGSISEIASPRRRLLPAALIAIFVAAKVATAPAARAADEPARPIVHHEITASLDVAANSIRVEDRVRLAAPPPAGEPWRFLLHQDLEIESVQHDGTPLSFDSRAGWNPRHFWRRPPYAELGDYDIAREIAVLPPSRWRSETPELVITYAGVIADSLHPPERAYGHSFETTTGRIVAEGAYLGGAAFWVPWSGEGLFTFALEVVAPADWRTISQGDLRIAQERDGWHVMRWECEQPMEEVYLISGPYEIREREHDGVRLMTFCYANTGPDVTDRYLDGTGRYLDMYGELFGPYPFGKFALVENYWQTGYGMPSFTFLGDRVIRLPWILDTSYGHEILHNWWGNGVFVDWERGNWCEGLTVYGADYHYKEMESADAARDYRRNTLLGYRDFAAGGGKDFALTQFRERESPSTQAIGYGKSMMVFHMLRAELGDEAFWNALRRFYREHLFVAADWDDLRGAFEDQAGRDLAGWFAQWVERPGAVQLAIEDVRLEEDPEGRRAIAGVLVQAEPAYDVHVPVEIETVSGTQVQHVRARAPRTAFAIPVAEQPLRLAVDPGFDLFRLLYAEEVAPALSGVLGADSTRIVVGADVAGEMRDALVALAEEWAADSSIVWVEENDDLGDFPGGTWFLGAGPSATRLRAKLTDGTELANASGSLVAAGRLDGRPDRPAALVLPENADVVAALGRKIPHYSKYSYLVFEGERNVDKGSWDIGASPLIVDLAGL